MTTENGESGNTSTAVTTPPPGGDSNGAREEHEPVWYESRASRMGWKPEHLYKGEAPWVDAKTFYTRGLEVLPIVNARNAALEAEIERLKASTRQALEVADVAHAREVEALKTQLAAAKDARKEAIKDGDGEAFEAADTKVKALETAVAETSSSPPSKQPQPTKYDPIFQAWLDLPANNWLRDDADAMAMAGGISMSSKFSALRGKGVEAWDAVANEVKRIMELQAGSSSRSELERPGPSGARPPSSSTTQTGGKTFQNLKSDYQQACDQMWRDTGKPGKLDDWRTRYLSACDPEAFKGA